MESYNFILFLAVILLSTKLLGNISKKIHLPAVVGALIAGVILGPSVLNFISLEGDAGTFLEYTAEIGVILLMFNAGLGTEMEELKENMLASAVTALIGVLVPLIGGFLSYALYFKTDFSNYNELLKAFFVGVVLTATSVSITVETLREMGKLKGRVGTTILGAAVIDDILGVIILTVITSFKDPSVNAYSVGIKIILYFVFLVLIAFAISKCIPYLEKHDHHRRSAIYSLVFAFTLSYISETFFGVADITGAYFAGLMLCRSKVEPYVERRIEIPSYMFFSPVFFAAVGLKVQLGGMNTSTWIFSILLLIVAFLTKVIGCALGARCCGFQNKEALQIGIGMISRGEVALIVAQKGHQVGLLDHTLFAPIILVVIVTTILTPVLLKISMQD
ncbi:cation:proton antiporter [Anaerostipes sp. MSJ-23]|uniref:cation:proton antiporter n=1 Tax=Anaerostipes sp. MSJ-23 TaxID=2841520 RepID=UPI001C11B32C|nr:cation:proton antiporter [Anaerostipes sp. MSJ-23]MBU5458928.1 cation:proton antiporter [Anaerostipes sp. MSJ-23]